MRKPARIETASELGAMSKAELADAYGPVAAALAVLEKRAGLMKKEFERRGVTLLVGAKWSVQRSQSSFDSVPIAKAREALGAEWCAANAEKVVRTSWKATAMGEGDFAAPEEC
jgi:hypothetical protein